MRANPEKMMNSRSKTLLLVVTFLDSYLRDKLDRVAIE